MTSQSNGVKLSDMPSGILDNISTVIWSFREAFMDNFFKKGRKSLIKEEEKSRLLFTVKQESVQPHVN